MKKEDQVTGRSLQKWPRSTPAKPSTLNDSLDAMVFSMLEKLVNDLDIERARNIVINELSAS